MAAGQHILSSTVSGISILYNLDMDFITSLIDSSQPEYHETEFKCRKDLNAFKYFIKNTVGQEGKWKSPGGKARRFISLKTDFI